jgi:hypothetical protein
MSYLASEPTGTEESVFPLSFLFKRSIVSDLLALENGEELKYDLVKPSFINESRILGPWATYDNAELHEACQLHLRFRKRRDLHDHAKPDPKPRVDNRRKRKHPSANSK